MLQPLAKQQLIGLLKQEQCFSNNSYSEYIKYKMFNRISNFYLKMLVLLSKKLYLCSDFQ